MQDMKTDLHHFRDFKVFSMREKEN